MSSLQSNKPEFSGDLAWIGFVAMIILALLIAAPYLYQIA